jgi:hypothetical protein
MPQYMEATTTHKLKISWTNTSHVTQTTWIHLLPNSIGITIQEAIRNEGIPIADTTFLCHQ